MSNTSTVLTFDTIRSVSSASMTGSYMPVGARFSFSPRILKFVNSTTLDVSISIDGVNQCDIIPSGGFALYDAGTNRGNAAPSLQFPEDMQIYASSGAGTGTFYIVVLYAFTPQSGSQGL